MRFEWDEAKNEINLRKHGIRFERAIEAFYDPMAVSIQDRDVEGEQRWKTLGRFQGWYVLVIAHALRDEDGDEIVRVISARKATPRERRLYEEGE